MGSVNLVEEEIGFCLWVMEWRVLEEFPAKGTT